MTARWWTMCVWLLVAAHTVYAQDPVSEVNGLVTDDRGNPLPGATVFIEDIHMGMATDLAGNFRFTRVPEGNYQLVVRYTGYQTQYLEVSVPLSKPLEVTLITDELLLENVVVSDEALSDIAVPETSLTADEMESTRGQSLAESLEKITGVNTLQTGASVAKPMLHGLHSNRILILNNGVRQEGQQWGAEHAPEIDPFTAQKLSVLKGAASVKYGPEAIGGVVIASPPDLPSTPEVSGEIHAIGMSNGRSGTGSVMLEGGLPAIAGLGWRVQGTLKQAGDMHAPDYSLTNTGIREKDVSATVGLKRSAFGIEAYYSHFETEIGILKTTGFIGSLDDLENIFENGRPLITDDFSYKIENPRQEVTHDLIKLKGYYLSNFGKISLQYALQLNHRQEFDIRRGALNEIPSMNLKIATHTLNLEVKHKPIGPVQGSMGMDFMYQDNDNIPGTQRSHFIPNFTNYSGGIYLIERLGREKWELEAGLRIDFQHNNIHGWNVNEGFYKDSFGFRNVTASVGGTYRFTEHSSFTTSLGTAWRPPHVAELYSFGKHQSTAGLEYGMLWNWDRQAPPPNNFFVQKFDEADIANEQGLKWVNTFQYATGPLSAEVTAYLNWIKNYIFIRPEGVTGSNVGALPYYWYRQTNALFAGFDANINLQILAPLSWQTKLSYLRAKDTKNEDELPFIPANKIATSLRYEKEKWVGMTNVFAQMGVSYTDKQRHAPRTIAIDDLFEAASQDDNIFATDSRTFDFLPPPDGYALVNIEAGASLKISDTSTLHWRLGVHNLFNVSYRNYTNRLRYYTDEAGRNFTLSLNYSF